MAGINLAAISSCCVTIFSPIYFGVNVTNKAMGRTYPLNNVLTSYPRSDPIQPLLIALISL